MKKLVIIPAYNECGSIQRAVDDIREHAPGTDMRRAEMSLKRAVARIETVKK